MFDRFAAHLARAAVDGSPAVAGAPHRGRLAHLSPAGVAILASPSRVPVLRRLATDTIRLLMRGALVAALATGGAPAQTLAQGGPPLLTDDPDTPGPGFWEVNLATLMDKTSRRRRLEMPRVDLNYGVGYRIQLKFEMPWVMVEDETSGTARAAGNATVGVKWRFAGQEGQTIAWSIYPQVEFNTTHASVVRQIEDAGYHVLTPTELTIEKWGVEINGEVGRVFAARGTGGWIVGLSTEGHVAPPLELVGEIRRDELAELMMVGGGRLTLTPKIILMLASGHTVRSTPSEGPRTYMYAGLQLNLPRQFAFVPAPPTRECRHK